MESDHFSCRWGKPIGLNVIVSGAEYFERKKTVSYRRGALVSALIRLNEYTFKRTEPFKVPCIAESGWVGQS